jgi:hypothetical protein
MDKYKDSFFNNEKKTEVKQGLGLIVLLHFAAKIKNLP